MVRNNIPSWICVTGTHALSAVALAVVVCSQALADDARAEIGIATMTVRQAPPGFEFQRTGQGQPGRWVVVYDHTVAGGRAIEQSSTDRTNYRFPLAIYEGMSAKNVDVVIRFKAMSGQVDQAGGIAVRVVSPDEYYVVRANALEDNVRFYRVAGGRRQQLAGADIDVKAGVWHTLGLKAENDRFTVSFDDKKLYSASDTAIPGPGRVALWTKADSVTRFSQIQIQMLP